MTLELSEELATELKDTLDEVISDMSSGNCWDRQRRLPAFARGTPGAAAVDRRTAPRLIWPAVPFPIDALPEEIDDGIGSSSECHIGPRVRPDSSRYALVCDIDNSGSNGRLQLNGDG